MRLPAMDEWQERAFAFARPRLRQVKQRRHRSIRH